MCHVSHTNVLAKLHRMTQSCCQCMQLGKTLSPIRYYSLVHAFYTVYTYLKTIKKMSFESVCHMRTDYIV